MIMLVGAASAHAQSGGDQTSTTTRASTEIPSASSAPVASQQAPAPIDQLTLANDLLGAMGFRSIGERRGELLVSTGNDATHHAALRASDRVRGLGIELTGDAMRSDVLGDQTEAGARVEHASERDRVELVGGYRAEHVGLARQSFASDLSAARFGAGWNAWRAPGRLELAVDGERQALHDAHATGSLDLDASIYSPRAGFTSRRVQALGLDHEFAAGAGIVLASGVATAGDPTDMPTQIGLLSRSKRGRHRFLNAYLHDTIRVIDSLDVHGGFVFEHWRWLTHMTPIYEHDVENGMNPEIVGALAEQLLSPQLGAVYRATPELALEAQAFRRLRAPTLPQLLRPVQNGGVLTIAGADLHAETVTGAQAGPALASGPLEARAVVYWNEIASPIAAISVDSSLRELGNLGHARELGVAASARWRIAKPWLAGVDYTFTHSRITGATRPELVGKQRAQTPRHRAAALVAFDDPRRITLTGAVHFVDRRFEDDRNTIAARPYTVVDAMAARKLTRGLAGFVAVENLFDRHYVTNRTGVDLVGAPRLVQVGVRLDSARW